MSRAHDRDPAPHGPAWLVTAAHIARRFYVDGASKTDIAEETGMSRFKVARMLHEARATGLVEVTVRLPAGIDPDLSAGLSRRYAPARAVVVSSPDGRPDARREAVARTAADLLSEVVSEDDVVGMSCSHTVAATTQALASLARCPVVQLCGTMAGPDIEAGSVESVRRAAQVGGGKAFPIYAPMLLPDAETARTLARQPSIRRVLEEAEAVTVAIVAVGGWAPELSTVWASAEPAELAELAAGGAVGEIAGRVFDAGGAAVASALDDRVLGVDLDRLRRIPLVVGLAQDGARAPAVRAALAGGLVDFLVCDDALARALLTVPGSARSAAPAAAATSLVSRRTMRHDRGRGR
jgi:DNA-binding transcriptional regulator LsrR (DeoR family)